MYFSDDDLSVIRPYAADGSLAEKYAIRVALEAGLGLRSSAWIKHKNLIVEDFVVGTPFSSLTIDQRQVVFRELCSRYAELTRAYGEAGYDEYRTSLEPSCYASSVVPIPGQPAAKTDTPQNVQTYERSMVPSHGDVHAGNLLVNGTTIHLIDFEDCEVLPFYYDLFNLAMSESEHGRHDITTDLLRGAFDMELSALWLSAGAAFRSTTITDSLRNTLAIYVHRWSRARQIDWSTAMAQTGETMCLDLIGADAAPMRSSPAVRPKSEPAWPSSSASMTATDAACDS